MKNNIKLFTIVFAFIYMLIGCGNSTDTGNADGVETILTVLTQVSTVEGEGFIKSTELGSDFSEWYFAKNGKKEYDKPLQEISVELNGQTYLAKYVSTVERISGTQVYYYYRGTNGELIHIDPANHSLKSIIIVEDYNPNFLCNNEMIAKCRRNAEEIAKQYIDIEKYQIEDVKTSDGTPYFCFVQYLNGQKLPAALSIGFAQNGKLTYFSCYDAEPNEIIAKKSASDTSKIKVAESLVTFESENTMALVNQKVEQLCADIKTEECKLLSSEVILLPDGTLVKQFNYLAKHYEYYKDEFGNKIKEGEGYLAFTEDLNIKVYVVAQ